MIIWNQLILMLYKWTVSIQSDFKPREGIHLIITLKINSNKYYWLEAFRSFQWYTVVTFLRLCVAIIRDYSSCLDFSSRFKCNLKNVTIFVWTCFTSYNVVCTQEGNKSTARNWAKATVTLDHHSLNPGIAFAPRTHSVFIHAKFVIFWVWWVWRNLKLT